MICLSSADFIQNELLKKNISVTLSECQTVWILIRPDILSGLIWIQTVCKDHQQTTKFATGRQRVKEFPNPIVVPTKSDSDVILYLQLLSKTLTFTLHLS